MEFGEDEAEEIRLALLEQDEASQMPLDEWNDILNKELGIF